VNARAAVNNDGTDAPFPAIAVHGDALSCGRSRFLIFESSKAVDKTRQSRPRAPAEPRASWHEACCVAFAGLPAALTTITTQQEERRTTAMEHSDHRRRNNQDRSNEARRGYEGDDDRDRGERQFGEQRSGEERGSRERYGEGGGARDSWRERGGSRDDRYGRMRERERYGQSSEESSFSPDWSRDEAEPIYSEDPYYLRNREYQGRTDQSARYYGVGDQGRDRERESGGSSGRYRQESEWRDREGQWRGDENRRTTSEQRDRGFTPRDQNERDWPRGADSGESYYRGSYRSSVTPYAYPGGRGALFMESWTLHGPYTGRGPKGYRRSNEHLIEEASQRLERDGQIDASDIEVTAEDGIIRLRGTVPDRAMKRRAEECVESIYGVHDVANELRVSRPGGEQSRGEQGSRSSPGGQGSLGDQYGQVSESSTGSMSRQESQRNQAARSGQGSQSADLGMESDLGLAAGSRSQSGQGSQRSRGTSSASSGSTNESADEDKKSQKDKQQH
jgi:hypothetical protein